jgi:putative transposase
MRKVLIFAAVAEAATGLALLVFPAALRADRTPPSRSNEVWAVDFLHDQPAKGTKLRILTVIDTFSRYAPIVDPGLVYRGADVVAPLEQVCKVIGYPAVLRVDQGSEFVSRDLDLWAYHNNVTLDFSRPGKPKRKSGVCLRTSKIDWRRCSWPMHASAVS